MDNKLDSKDIPSRLVALRSRFINEATSMGMVAELDDIIAELISRLDNNELN